MSAKAVPMKILFTQEQRRMVEWLANRQRRSMNDAVRLAVERVYQAEAQREADVQARAEGRARVVGRSG